MESPRIRSRTMLQDPGTSEIEPRIPHITILHPRHARGNEEVLDSVRAEALPDAVTFREISRIEQRSGGPWRALNTYPKHESV